MSEDETESRSFEIDEGSLDAIQVQQALDRLRSEQKLLAGIGGGAIGAVLGAAAWAAITVLTGYQIGFMAVGVGFLAGFGTRLMGRGVDQSFGVVGAALSLAGCALGNLLAVCGLVAKQEGMPYFELLAGLDLEVARELLVATFNPIDLVFYGIAVYEGYKVSFRQLAPEDFGMSAEGGI